MRNYIDYRKVEKPLNFHDITVEIGFGSGDYLIELAKQSRESIFFGIEKSWIPVNKILRKCRDLGLDNIYCTKLDAYWAFQLLFRDSTVREIIINYPDPWFKKSHMDKRLTKKENLYLYARKLSLSGQLNIRTDDAQFVDFTLKEASKLKCFSYDVSNPIIYKPRTKYERKWLEMGKRIWDIKLRKNAEPQRIEIKEIREVKELFPVRIEEVNLNLKGLENREYKIEENLYLKCFSLWETPRGYGIEVLLSESGFLQAFLVEIKIRENYSIIDVSKFSEILKTEGVKKALYFISEQVRFK